MIAMADCGDQLPRTSSHPPLTKDFHYQRLLSLKLYHPSNHPFSCPRRFFPYFSSPLPSWCLTTDNLHSCTMRPLPLSAASLFPLSSLWTMLSREAQVLQEIHHLLCHDRIERNFWSSQDLSPLMTLIISTLSSSTNDDYLLLLSYYAIHSL